MLTNLEPLIKFSQKNSTAIAAVNIFGYEDALAVVDAAEQSDVPIILSAAKDLIEFMPLEIISAMLRKLAESAKVPVCLHLDHCYDKKIIRQALDAGFTSVMFDGSQLPLHENIACTKEIVDLAKTYQATVEGEIGSVSYTSGRKHIKHELTNPNEANRFYNETGVHIMAVSVGNVHRLEDKAAAIDFGIIEEISLENAAPLCIHGVSGIPDTDIRKLAKQTNTVKLNVATLFRMEWGNRLRTLMNDTPAEYDRIYFMRKLHPFLTEKIKSFLNLLS